jgi:DNA-binding GntR family transcriptional regulator
MYQVRERLEPLLLRLNVPLLTDDSIDGLEFLADSMEACADVERFLRLDREFHLSCLNAASTSLLGDIVLNLWNRTQHYRRAATRLFYREGDRSVHHDHQLIVNALRKRDPEEAEQVLSRHIRRSRLELAHHPELFDHR